MPKVTSSEVESLLNALVSQVQADAIASALPLANNSQIQLALSAIDTDDPSLFWETITYPVDHALYGLMHARGFSDRLQFLYIEHEFVDRQFGWLIQKFEGTPCYADKCRTIIQALAQHLRTKKPIAWNYTQEFTYHLPQTIFTTEAEIVGFFEALYMFHWGQSEPYLRFLRENLSRLSTNKL